MTDKILMDILNATDDLPEVELRLLFSDLIVLYEVVQLTLGGEFHDDEDVVGGVEHFVKLDDVGVVDEFEDLDLSFYLN